MNPLFERTIYYCHSADGVINLTEKTEGVAQQFVLQQLNTKEKLIRDELIALGWTPPGADLLPLAEMVRDACYAAEIGMGVGPDVDLPAIIERFNKGV